MKIAKDLQPKWVNYAPCYPCCDDWVDFRKQVFIALEKVHHGVLPFLRAAYRDQTLLMEGWINGSEDHKKTDKALINDDASFKEFAEVALAMPTNVKMGLKLLQPKNPKDDEDANPHLFNFYTHESQKPIAISDESEEEEESEGRSVSDEVDLYWFIRC